MSITKRLFAIDQNFPEPVIDALALTLGELAELVPVRKIAGGLGDVDDWELLRALYRDARPWDGLITCDSAMLAQPREMVVLDQTKLSLVVTESAGHNPIKATGTLLCHLAHVCHHTDPSRAQIWKLKVSQKNAESPAKYLEEMASRRGASLPTIYSANRLSVAELEGREESADE